MSTNRQIGNDQSQLFGRFDWFEVRLLDDRVHVSHSGLDRIDLSDDRFLAGRPDGASGLDLKQID